MPRPNVYQSLHTSVVSDRGLPFEVQIRTDRHAPDRRGRHRGALEVQGRPGRHQAGRAALRWLRQLIEWQQEIRDPQEFIQHLKVDLYPEEVYCFTPRGEVKALPRGATPVDFAYAIHTDVGHQCVGARVNGSIVPLRTHLRNGDIVEIMTQPGHQPSRDWLSATPPPRGPAARSATTSRARRRRARSSSASGSSTRKRAASTCRRSSSPTRPAEGGARARAAAGGRPDRRGRLRQDLGAPGAVEDRRRRRAAREAARDRPRLDGQAGAPARRRTASRSRASTISWSSAPAAATRFAARRSSATSAAARACRCTRRRARTSST